MTTPHDNVVDLSAYREARALQRGLAAAPAHGEHLPHWSVTMFPSAYSPMFVPVVWVPYWMPAMPVPERLAVGAEDA